MDFKSVRVTFTTDWIKIQNLQMHDFIKCNRWSWSCSEDRMKIISKSKVTVWWEIMKMMSKQWRHILYVLLSSLYFMHISINGQKFSGVTSLQNLFSVPSPIMVTLSNKVPSLNNFLAEHWGHEKFLCKATFQIERKAEKTFHAFVN